MSEVNPYQAAASAAALPESPPSDIAFCSAGYITVRDVKAAFRLASAKVRPLRLIALGMFVMLTSLLALLAISVMFTDLRSGLSILAVASVLPLILAGRVLFQHWRLASYARRRIGTFGYLEVFYSSKGIHTKTPKGEGLMPWSDFGSVFASDQVAIVRERHSAQFYIAARGTLHQPQHWEEFIAYVREQVADRRSQ